jgi:hypothetical protein
LGYNSKFDIIFSPYNTHDAFFYKDSHIVGTDVIEDFLESNLYNINLNPGGKFFIFLNINNYFYFFIELKNILLDTVLFHMNYHLLVELQFQILVFYFLNFIFKYFSLFSLCV